MILSAFGQLFESIRIKRGIKKTDFARAAGITDRSVLTHSLKAKSEPGAYAPRPEWLPIWADLMELEGADRDWFILLGYLARCGPEAEQLAVSMFAQKETEATDMYIRRVADGNTP